MTVLYIKMALVTVYEILICSPWIRKHLYKKQKNGPSKIPTSEPHRTYKYVNYMGKWNVKIGLRLRLRLMQ